MEEAYITYDVSDIVSIFILYEGIHFVWAP